MKERLQALQDEAMKKIGDIKEDLRELNDIRVSYLGKKECCPGTIFYK